jgi:hypothetical protein
MVGDMPAGTGDAAPQLYQAYFQKMPCFAAVQDREMRLVETNELFRRTFGERSGGHCWEVCKQRPSPCPDCPVEQTFRTGKEQSAREVVRTPAGEDISSRRVQGARR